MKTRNIEETLRNRGFERGTLYVLEQQNEQIRMMEKNMATMAQMLNQMVDALNNVVDGATGMKMEMQKALKKAGVSVDSEDIGENTHRIGND